MFLCLKLHSQFGKLFVPILVRLCLVWTLAIQENCIQHCPTFFLWTWVQRLSQLCRSLGEKEVSPPCSLATLIMSGRPMEDLIGQATWIVANWINIKKQSKTNNWWNFQDLMTCNDFIMYSAYKLPNGPLQQVFGSISELFERPFCITHSGSSGNVDEIDRNCIHLNHVNSTYACLLPCMFCSGRFFADGSCGRLMTWSKATAEQDKIVWLCFILWWKEGRVKQVWRQCWLAVVRWDWQHVLHKWITNGLWRFGAL